MNPERYEEVNKSFENGTLFRPRERERERTRQRGGERGREREKKRDRKGENDGGRARARVHLLPLSGTNESSILREIPFLGVREREGERETFPSLWD